MERDVARHVIRSSFRSFKELTLLLPVLKDHCDPAEYETLAKIIATIGADLELTLNKHIYAAFPDLRGEVEATVDKYRRVI